MLLLSQASIDAVKRDILIFIHCRLRYMHTARVALQVEGCTDAANEGGYSCPCVKRFIGQPAGTRHGGRPERCIFQPI